jgi:hypothetical protein
LRFEGRDLHRVMVHRELCPMFILGIVFYLIM